MAFCFILRRPFVPKTLLYLRYVPIADPHICHGDFWRIYPKSLEVFSMFPVRNGSFRWHFHPNISAMTQDVVFSQIHANQFPRGRSLAYCAHIVHFMKNHSSADNAMFRSRNITYIIYYPRSSRRSGFFKASWFHCEGNIRRHLPRKKRAKVSRLFVERQIYSITESDSLAPWSSPQFNERHYRPFASPRRTFIALFLAGQG